MFIFPEQYYSFLSNYLINDLIKIIDIYYLKTENDINIFKDIKIYNNIHEIPPNCTVENLNILTKFYKTSHKDHVDIKYAYNFWENIKEIYFDYTELSEDCTLDNSVIGKLKNDKYFKYDFNSDCIHTPNSSTIYFLVLDNSLSNIINNYTTKYEMEWFVEFQSK